MSRATKEKQRIAKARKVQSSKAAEVKGERPVVAVLIPSYKSPHPRMQMAFGAMERFTAPYADVLPSPIIQTSVVHWTRNSLLAELIKSGRPFTHVLFLDDDIVVGKDYLLKLLAHNKDIIGALCTRRQDPPIPNARLLDKASGRFEELWEWPDGLVEVGAIGTGMLLISRHALQQIAEVYFQCRYEKDVHGMPEEKAKQISAERVKAFDGDANAWWFRFLAPLNGVGEMGEDISFCWVAARYAGIPVYVDTTLQPEHMGDYGFAIKDFIDHREPLIAKAKADGRYINPPSLLAVPESRIVVVD